MPKSFRAFTLIEMLSAIAIIAVLAVLSMASLERVRKASDRTATLNSLRQLGNAIQLYLSDNEFTLPGPLTSGQYATYTSKDGRSLGYHLWHYYNAPEPTAKNQTLKALTNPANTRYRRKPTSPVYIMNTRVPEYPSLNPWGYDNGDGNASQPSKLIKFNNNSTSWAVQDADADHPLSKPAGGWGDSVPLHPPLGKVRMTLFFDWHVEPVKVEE